MATIHGQFSCSQSFVNTNSNVMFKPIHITHKCRYFCGIMIPEGRSKGQMGVHVYNVDDYSQLSPIRLPISYSIYSFWNSNLIYGHRNLTQGGKGFLYIGHNKYSHCYVKILLECNCHNKAQDCYYDENVANQRRSLNVAGQFRGGGVCINCLQNTMGINCETCIDGYYRPYKVRVNLIAFSMWKRDFTDGQLQYWKLISFRNISFIFSFCQQHFSDIHFLLYLSYFLAQSRMFTCYLTWIWGPTGCVTLVV